MDLVTLAIAKKYTEAKIAEASTGEIDLSAYAKTTYVDEKVAGIVESAPDTLNTLNELAAALGDDPNFAATIAAQIGGKADKSALGTLATKSTVAKSDLTAAVQTSLGKADTALQSYTETDPTVPAWAKEENKPTYTASEVGAVPTTRTVNNKALSANISLTASDVGALPSTTTLFSGDYNDLTNKPTIPSIAGLASETYVNNAVAGKVDTSALATVATSGSYNDLKNKPTIPSIAGLATEEYVNNAVANIILTSEGGKKFKLTVDDTGTLTATEVTE